MLLAGPRCITNLMSGKLTPIPWAVEARTILSFLVLVLNESTTHPCIFFPRHCVVNANHSVSWCLRLAWCKIHGHLTFTVGRQALQQSH